MEVLRDAKTRISVNDRNNRLCPFVHATITIAVPIGLFRRSENQHHEGMSLTGSLAILAGWLMIMPLERQGAGWRRYLQALLGTSILAAGMFAVIQCQF